MAKTTFTATEIRDAVNKEIEHLEEKVAIAKKYHLKGFEEKNTERISELRGMMYILGVNLD